MDISFKQALKAPLSWKLLIVAFLITLPNIYMLNYLIDFNQPAVFNQSPIYVWAYIAILAICTLLNVAYSILFAHNRIHNNTPLFPNFSWTLIKTGLKNIVFMLGCYIVIALVGLLIMAVESLPNAISITVGVIGIIFAFYYVIVATARFMDTLLMRSSFQVYQNFSIMKNYWKSFLYLLLYNVVVLIVLAIPFLLFQILLTMPLQFNLSNTAITITISIAVFIEALLRSYIAFTCLNVFAQGYAWIKADKAAKENKIEQKTGVALKKETQSKTVVQKPVKKSTQKTPVKTTKTVVKSAPAKKGTPSKTTVKKAATASKNIKAKVATKPTPKKVSKKK